MGSEIAVTENGVHKIGNKLFLTDESLSHRKANKVFLTVGGVHRLFYSSEVVWAKYSCDYTPSHYEKKEPTGTRESDWYSPKITLYDNYSFSESSGYSGRGANDYSASSGAVGRYKVTNTEVLKITSLTSISSYLHYKGRIVATCRKVAEAYSKGSTFYDTITTEDGQLPESGTLIAGSANNTYCVLRLPDGNNYYYVRGD